MTLNKMVREVGRRTRLKNRDVQFVLETQTINRGEQRGTLTSGEAPRIIRWVSLRVSRKLKNHINSSL